MALIVVNLTDTFDEWRTKTNSSIAQIGDLSALATANSASIVGALNGLLDEVKDDLTPELGGNLDLNSKNITGTGQFAGTSIAGTVIGTTQAAGNNTTLLATTAFVTAAVTSEDTLEEMNDTTIAGLADLNILQYDLGTTSWKNRTMTAAGIPTTGFTVAMAIALG